MDFEEMFEQRVQEYMDAYDDMPRIIAEMFATFDLTDETCFVPEIEEE